MSFIVQFLIIMAISFLGELLSMVVPLPIPAGIYGMLFLFTGLCTGLIPLKSVKTVGDFLIEIMPLTIVPSAVGLMEQFGLLRKLLVPFLVISIVVTFVVMAASSLVTQGVIVVGNRSRKKGGEKGEAK